MRKQPYSQEYKDMQKWFLAPVLAMAWAGGCAEVTQKPKDTNVDSDTSTVDTDSMSESIETTDTSDLDTDIIKDWSKITAWAFWMGTPDGSCPADYPGGSSCIQERGRSTDERLHYVALTYDYYISPTEVTQEQFEAVMKYNPAYFGPNGQGPNCGGTCPVESVTWYDALAYANQLSQLAGLEPCYVLTEVVCRAGTQPNVGSGYIKCFDGDSTSKDGIASATVNLYRVSEPQKCPSYRLPTESEWEYAARSDTLSALPNGDLNNDNCDSDPNLNAIAWYCGNSSISTNPAKKKSPNFWGLYDIIGNVSEWTWDLYAEDYPVGTKVQPIRDPVGPESGSHRVVRGGSFSDLASATRCGAREGNRLPGYSSSSLGFRLVRTVEDNTEIDSDTE
jgi:formylglycine-generating enzyme required for sulfatase activity